MPPSRSATSLARETNASLQKKARDQGVRAARILFPKEKEPEELEQDKLAERLARKQRGKARFNVSGFESIRAEAGSLFAEPENVTAAKAFEKERTERSAQKTQMREKMRYLRSRTLPTLGDYLREEAAGRGVVAPGKQEEALADKERAGEVGSRSGMIERERMDRARLARRAARRGSLQGGNEEGSGKKQQQSLAESEEQALEELREELGPRATSGAEYFRQEKLPKQSLSSVKDLFSGAGSSSTVVERGSTVLGGGVKKTGAEQLLASVAPEVLSFGERVGLLRQLALLPPEKRQNILKNPSFQAVVAAVEGDVVAAVNEQFETKTLVERENVEDVSVSVALLWALTRLGAGGANIRSGILRKIGTGIDDLDLHQTSTALFCLAKHQGTLAGLQISSQINAPTDRGTGAMDEGSSLSSSPRPPRRDHSSQSGAAPAAQTVLPIVELLLRKVKIELSSLAQQQQAASAIVEEDAAEEQTVAESSVRQNRKTKLSLLMLLHALGPLRRAGTQMGSVEDLLQVLANSSAELLHNSSYAMFVSKEKSSRDMAADLFTPKEVAQVASLFAGLGHHDPHLMSLIKQYFQQLMAKSSSASANSATSTVDVGISDVAHLCRAMDRPRRNQTILHRLMTRREENPRSAASPPNGNTSVLRVSATLDALKPVILAAKTAQVKISATSAGWAAKTAQPADVADILTSLALADTFRASGQTLGKHVLQLAIDALPCSQPHEFAKLVHAAGEVYYSAGRSGDARDDGSGPHHDMSLFHELKVLVPAVLMRKRESLAALLSPAQTALTISGFAALQIVHTNSWSLLEDRVLSQLPYFYPENYLQLFVGLASASEYRLTRKISDCGRVLRECEQEGSTSVDEVVHTPAGGRICSATSASLSQTIFASTVKLDPSSHNRLSNIVAEGSLPVSGRGLAEMVRSLSGKTAAFLGEESFLLLQNLRKLYTVCAVNEELDVRMVLGDLRRLSENGSDQNNVGVMYQVFHADPGIIPALVQNFSERIRRHNVQSPIFLSRILEEFIELDVRRPMPPLGRAGRGPPSTDHDARSAPAPDTAVALAFQAARIRHSRDFRVKKIVPHIDYRFLLDAALSGIGSGRSIPLASETTVNLVGKRRVVFPRTPAAMADSDVLGGGDDVADSTTPSLDVVCRNTTSSEGVVEFVPAPLPSASLAHRSKTLLGVCSDRDLVRMVKILSETSEDVARAVRQHLAKKQSLVKQLDWRIADLFEPWVLEYARRSSTGLSEGEGDQGAFAWGNLDLPLEMLVCCAKLGLRVSTLPGFVDFVFGVLEKSLMDMEAGGGDTSSMHVAAKFLFAAVELRIVEGGKLRAVARKVGDCEQGDF